MLRQLATTAAVAIAATYAAPSAHAAKVIVLAVEGDRDGELEDGLSTIVEDRHDLVTSSQAERAAKKAHIDDLDGPAIGKLARKLGADAVVEGAMSREDEGYTLVVRIRSNSGKTVKKISMDLRKPRLSGKARKRLTTGVLDGIDQVLGIEDAAEDEDEADDEERGSRARGKARKSARAMTDDDDIEIDDDEEDEDRERVAARDDMDNEDLDRALGVDRKAGVRDDDADKLPAFIVAAGPSAVMRTLSFSSRDYEQAPTGYKSSMVPGAHVQAEAYPLALKSDGILSGFGVGFEYDQTLLLTTASSDSPMTKLPTDEKHWMVNARFRIKAGKSATVTLHGGYGRRTFIVDRSSLPEGAKLDMPDVDYRFYDPGLTVHYAIGKAGIHAGGEAMLFKQAGYIQRTNSYGGAKITGVDARAGVDFKVTDKIVADVTGSYTQIGFVFTGDGEETNNRDLDPTTPDVGGAADVYMGIVGTVGYTY
jgi:hypothetical protein